MSDTYENILEVGYDPLPSRPWPVSLSRRSSRTALSLAGEHLLMESVRRPSLRLALSGVLSGCVFWLAELRLEDPLSRFAPSGVRGRVLSSGLRGRLSMLRLGKPGIGLVALLLSMAVSIQST